MTKKEILKYIDKNYKGDQAAFYKDYPTVESFKNGGKFNKYPDGGKLPSYSNGTTNMYGYNNYGGYNAYGAANANTPYVVDGNNPANFIGDPLTDASKAPLVVNEGDKKYQQEEVNFGGNSAQTTQGVIGAASNMGTYGKLFGGIASLGTGLGGAVGAGIAGVGGGDAKEGQQIGTSLISNFVDPFSKQVQYAKEGDGWGLAASLAGPAGTVAYDIYKYSKDKKETEAANLAKEQKLQRDLVTQSMEHEDARRSAAMAAANYNKTLATQEPTEYFGAKNGGKIPIAPLALYGGSVNKTYKGDGETAYDIEGRSHSNGGVILGDQNGNPVAEVEGKEKMLVNEKGTTIISQANDIEDDNIISMIDDTLKNIMI